MSRMRNRLQAIDNLSKSGRAIPKLTKLEPIVRSPNPDRVCSNQYGYMLWDFKRGERPNHTGAKEVKEQKNRRTISIIKSSNRSARLERRLSFPLPIRTSSTQKKYTPPPSPKVPEEKIEVLSGLEDDDLDNQYEFEDLPRL